MGLGEGFFGGILGGRLGGSAALLTGVVLSLCRARISCF